MPVAPSAAESEAFYERAAALAGFTYVRLDPGEGRDPVDPIAASLLTSSSARALGVLPIAHAGGRLVVALPDPREEEVIHSVATLTGLEVTAVVASPQAIARASDRVYGPEVPPGPAAAALAGTEGAPPEPPSRLRPRRRLAEERRYRELARHAGLDYLDLEPPPDAHPSNIGPIYPDAAALLPEDVCRRLRALPIAIRNGTVSLATAEPFDETASQVVHGLTGLRPRIVVTTPSGLERALDRVFGAPVGTVDEPEPVLPPEVVDLLRVGPPPELPTPPREYVALPLGELLLERGLVTHDQLHEALRIQRRSGSRLGEVVLHAGMVDERELATALADQLQVPDLDVSAFEPDPAALALIPEPIARRHRLVPLSIRDHVLYVAMADPLAEDVLATLREHTDLPIRRVVATRGSVDQLLQRLYASRYVAVATTELLNRQPEESAYKVLSIPQKVSFIVLTVVAVLLFLRHPIGTIVAINIGSIAFYSTFSLYKFRLIFDALRHSLELPVTDEEVAAIDERELPTYTILVPLYREAAVVPRLTESIRKLDYPRAKLDVKLIVEEDDDDTIRALRQMHLPPHFKMVVVPDAQPKTKPKACNYGLIQAEGKYVVIFDAEDRPEADQLKKVVVAFRKAENRITCIQCKLNYFNRNQNLLTRWFTSEYSNWFDLLMPGLDAADAPIPLGGTSNHFITERLIELGAWDPFNVTEDADLGVRLHKAGYKTAIIDSTTFEEANSDLYNWIRQRSRWVKGYIQTWLVHMRHPVRLWRQLGTRGFLSFQFIIGGTFFSFLVNPIYWLLTTAWLLTQAGLIRTLFPGFLYYAAAGGLYLGNFTFTYINVAGAMRRKYYDLVKSALLSPLYWGLMSVGAWKGFLQLFYRPFYWEKTVHGLDAEHAGPPVPRTPASSSSG